MKDLKKDVETGSEPRKSAGNPSLDLKVEWLVIDFYEEQENSWEMPGKKILNQ